MRLKLSVRRKRQRERVNSIKRAKEIRIPGFLLLKGKAKMFHGKMRKKKNVLRKNQTVRSMI